MRRVTAVIVILALSLCAGAACLGPQQDPKPAKPAVKATNFEEVLRPFIGMKCSVNAESDLVFLDFAGAPHDTLDMVGTDFVRVSNGRLKAYYPFTSIKAIFTR